MTKPGSEGTRFLESFGYAAQGVRCAFRMGRNFRVQAAAAVLVVILGFAFSLSALEWVAIVVCIGGVLSAECMNTAIEAAVDLASPQLHPLAKVAKDMAAASVLVFSCASFVVGIIVFLPKIMQVVC